MSDYIGYEYLDDDLPPTQMDEALPPTRKRKHFDTQDAFKMKNNEVQGFPESQKDASNKSSSSQEEMLKKILENQNKLFENQKRVEEKINKLEEYIKDNVADKCVVMANSHMIRGFKVTLQQLKKSMYKITGDDENDLQIEIAATLPLSSIDAAQDVENKLQKPEYLEAMKFYMLQQKGANGTVDNVFRRVLKDELVDMFNFDGVKNKRALSELTLINNLLSDVFASEGRNSFEKQIKKSVELSHNRFKHIKKKPNV